MADNWVSPTGFVDADSSWADETNAYDGDTGTGSVNSTDGDYLILNIASIQCDKVRIWVSHTLTACKGEVDVYYGAAWHNLRDGAIAEGEWVELAIGSTEAVTSARVRSDYIIGILTVFEFAFNKVGPTTYTSGITLDMLLQQLDSETVSLDALLLDTDAVSIVLDAVLGTGGAETIALDALLRATDSETVTLDALLQAADSRGIALDMVAVDRLISQLALDALLRGSDTGSADLDALLQDTDSGTLSLDLILVERDYSHPFYIEVRDPDDVLLGVIRDIIGGSLEQATNVPDVLSFDIPANEIRAEYLSRKNQIWVRDAYTDTVISICRIQMAEDSD